MTIRTVEQLFDLLSGELAWRKKELAILKSLVEQRSLSNEHRTVLLRAGVALLYAHWEGFVKAASGAYLEFVSFQRLRYQDLAPNFIALSARRLFRSASQTDKLQAHVDLAKFFMNDLGSRSTVPYKDAVNTRSNLSSQVLREILFTLGFDWTVYATKEKVIDEHLLEFRNTIAHGVYLTVTEDAYVELHRHVIEMMDTFRTQVDNAASMKLYTQTA